MMKQAIFSASAPAAIVAAYGYSNALGPVKRAMATVTGSVEVFDSWRASMNSFHVATNARIAVVNSAGVASGRTTMRNAWPRVAPSTRAASSSSHGRSRKKLVSVYTVSGSTKEMFGMISAW